MIAETAKSTAKRQGHRGGDNSTRGHYCVNSPYGWCTKSICWVSLPHTCTHRPVNFGFTLGNDLVLPNLFLTPFLPRPAQKLCGLAESLVWGPVYALWLCWCIWGLWFGLPFETSCSWLASPCFLELTAQPSPPSCPLAGPILPLGKFILLTHFPGKLFNPSASTKYFSPFFFTPT